MKQTWIRQMARCLAMVGLLTLALGATAGSSSSPVGTWKISGKMKGTANGDTERLNFTDVFYFYNDGTCQTLGATEGTWSLKGSSLKVKVDKYDAADFVSYLLELWGIDDQLEVDHVDKLELTATFKKGKFSSGKISGSISVYIYGEGYHTAKLSGDWSAKKSSSSAPQSELSGAELTFDEALIGAIFQAIDEPAE